MNLIRFNKQTMIVARNVASVSLLVNPNRIQVATTDGEKHDIEYPNLSDLKGAWESIGKALESER